MDQISKETLFSKGKVHYLIKNWKEKVKETDLDEVRGFSSLVKKSNISIEQCTQGFRMLNILKSFGIIRNLDILDNDNDDIESNGFDNHTNEDNFNELLTFVEEIYNNCKKLKISPAFIASWIKDLIDCRPLIDINKKEDSENFDDIIEQSIIPTQEQQQVNNLKDFEKPINKETKYLNLNDNEKTTNSSIETLTSEIKVPFVSQVSFFISEKKKERL